MLIFIYFALAYPCESFAEIMEHIHEYLSCLRIPCYFEADMI